MLYSKVTLFIKHTRHIQLTKLYVTQFGQSEDTDLQSYELLFGPKKHFQITPNLSWRCRFTTYQNARRVGLDDAQSWCLEQIFYEHHATTSLVVKTYVVQNFANNDLSLYTRLSRDFFNLFSSW